MSSVEAAGESALILMVRFLRDEGGKVGRNSRVWLPMVRPVVVAAVARARYSREVTCWDLRPGSDFSVGMNGWG
jgi:hypothetical protein